MTSASGYVNHGHSRMSTETYKSAVISEIDGLFSVSIKDRKAIKAIFEQAVNGYNTDGNFDGAKTLEELSERYSKEATGQQKAQQQSAALNHRIQKYITIAEDERTERLIVGRVESLVKASFSALGSIVVAAKLVGRGLLSLVFRAVLIAPDQDSSDIHKKVAHVFSAKSVAIDGVNLLILFKKVYQGVRDFFLAPDARESKDGWNHIAVAVSGELHDNPRALRKAAASVLPNSLISSNSSAIFAYDDEVVAKSQLSKRGSATKTPQDSVSSGVEID